MNEISEPKAIEFAIQIGADEEIDLESIDVMTRLLRSELEEFPDTEQVRLAPAAKQSQGGKKSGELIAIGAVLAGVLPQAVPALIDYLKEWMLRPGNRPLKIVARVGERSLEVEFDPRTVSDTNVRVLAAEIQALVDQKPG